jgi:antitoxin component YwqK of YwqJK toxin-antitoxin module
MELYQRYYSNTSQLRLECPLKNGKKHGVYKSYYGNGFPELITNFNDGVEQGIEQAYYPSGCIWYKAEFKDGNKHGKTLTWLDCSKFACKEEMFHEGKLHGVCKTFRKNGTLLTEQNYKHGEL